VLQLKSSIDGFFYFVFNVELLKFINCPERHFITYRALIYVVCKLKSILSFPLFSIIHFFMSSNRYNHLYTSCLKASSAVRMPIDMIAEVEIKKPYEQEEDSTCKKQEIANLQQHRRS
jgi:hypothetical protein